MLEEKRIGAIILMGGEGRRFGSEIPKQFHLLGDKKVYCHTLEALQSTALFDEIVLVSRPDRLDLAHEGVRVVAGGTTRQESSLLGLKAFTLKPDIVLIHDGVRPFVSERILLDNVKEAIQWGAVDTCIPSADTLVYAPHGKAIESIPERRKYLRGQTPQTFRFDWILEAHKRAKGVENATDDCQLVLQMGKKIHIVMGEERNMKITSELDLLLAEQLLAVSSAGNLNQRI